MAVSTSMGGVNAFTLMMRSRESSSLFGAESPSWSCSISDSSHTLQPSSVASVSATAVFSPNVKRKTRQNTYVMKQKDQRRKYL